MRLTRQASDTLVPVIRALHDGGLRAGRRLREVALQARALPRARLIRAQAAEVARSSARARREGPSLALPARVRPAAHALLTAVQLRVVAGEARDAGHLCFIGPVIGYKSGLMRSQCDVFP